MANLLEQAIECNDGNHAAKIIERTRDRIRWRRQLRFPKDVAGRSRAACPHHR